MPNQISYAHRGGSEPLIGESIATYLEDVVARFGDREAVVSCHQDKRLTYSELWAETGRLAAGLLSLGVERGDRVGIWAVDNLEWLELQLATARVGAILVNINPAYRAFELEQGLRMARVQTLFLMPEFRHSHYVETLLEVCPELATSEPGELSCPGLPELSTVVVFDPEDSAATERPARGFYTWPEVFELGATQAPGAVEERSATLECDDPINIQFTSGTTGFPKPVVLTHHNILNNGYFVGRALATTPEDRLCVPVPFYHCFGMVVSNLGCLSHGATLVVPGEHFDAEATLAAVDRERCTLLHGVPTMFVALLGHERFAEFDVSSLRSGIMAGAPCPPELMRRVMEDMGCRDILIGYGQTESSPVTHVTAPDDSIERRTQTVGFNLPHQEVKIVDPADGSVVPRGVQGEVCFRGYQVMQGYFELEHETSETIDRAGWLHSGDLGVMDGDGYVSITGRLKEMVIRGGENIYPAEIEAYLCRHPKVAQAAVFGLPHERLGEDLGAWVQLHNGDTADPEELRQFVRKGMAHYKVPRYLQIVDEFPMTVTGKIQKFKIRDLVLEELVKAAREAERAEASGPPRKVEVEADAGRRDETLVS